MDTRESLTGSEAQRQSEILNKWLVFEPLSNENFSISGNLYSVPVGQTFEPDMVVNSGSYEKDENDIIQIRKDIHTFEVEKDATLFIRDIGMKNIAAIKDRYIHGKRWIEIHLINHNVLNFDLFINNLEERNGFKVEIFKSSSFGLSKANREIKKDRNGTVVSDTYLKFFDVEE